MRPEITILTEPISFFERSIFLLKKFVRHCFNVRVFGPVRVYESIVSGLRDLKAEYLCNINPKISEIATTVYVPGPAEALWSAIKLKREGKICRLVVGPNISVPLSKKDIFFAPEIDVIITPCGWVRDYFLSLSSGDSRISIWSAGIEALSPSPRRGDKLIVYRKNCPDALFTAVVEELKRRRIPYEVLQYGAFHREDYLAALDRASAMVYLQESESQGLALHEAWMKDIPTIVWDRGFWRYKTVTWHADKISAPYLSESCGLFFKDTTDFSVVLSRFLNALQDYSPRVYSLENFSNAVATRRLLDILKR